MVQTRRQFDGNFKSKMALEAIRGLRPIREIAKQFKVHPNQVATWQKQLLDGAEVIFESGTSSSKKTSDVSIRRQCQLLSIQRSSLLA